MANDSPVLPLLRVQQALPALPNYWYEARDHVNEDRTSLQDVQLHLGRGDLQEGVEDVP